MASTSSYPSLSFSPSNINQTDALDKMPTGKVLTVLFYCIGSFGFLGNMFVLIVLGSSSTLRKNRTNILIMNLSTLDLLGALFLILTTAIDHVRKGNYAYCVLWETKLPFWMLMISSTYSLMLITIDRYLAIVHDGWYRRKVTDRHIIISMVFPWILGIGFSITHTFIASKLAADGTCVLYLHYRSFMVKRGVGVFMFTVNFLIPIVANAFCHIRIYDALWIRQRNVIDDEDFCRVTDHHFLYQNKKLRKNVIVTLISVNACFIACWLCNQFYFLLSHFGYPFELESNFYKFTVLAAFCNCCIDPIVYTVKYIPFKERAREMICCYKKDNTAGSTDEMMSESTLFHDDDSLGPEFKFW